MKHIVSESTADKGSAGNAGCASCAGAASAGKAETAETDSVTESADGSAKKKFLPVITGLFVGVLVLSNILAAKMVQLGPFIFDGGTLLFPLS